MQVGQLVYNKEYERGIIQKISPSGFLVQVKFQNFGEQILLISTLTELN